MPGVAEHIVTRVVVMASRVYFADIRAGNPDESKIKKIQRLFDAAGFGDLIMPDSLTAVKVHFGERGNDAYTSPVFVRQVVDKIKALGGKAFVTDTATLYAGSRSHAVDHATLAIEHGFCYAVVGAPIIIADGLKSGNSREVSVQGSHFKSVKIAGDIAAADAMIVISHFKGHDLAGFGGAIKNLGMGCATRAGKAEQHLARPTVNREACDGCGLCTGVCPAAAMALEDGKAEVHPEHCVGCGDCIRTCRTGAVDFDWNVAILPFIERMTEYALGAVAGKRNRVGYINFLLNITPLCDCLAWSDAPIVPDIGILASMDPVAIDRASYDLVNSMAGLADSALSHRHAPGEDKFKGAHDYTDGYHQITYGKALSLGDDEYELIRI